VRVQQGAAKLAAAGAPIARAEGFEVHAESMEARVRENQGE
jgi:histidinol dehydrogenase